MSTTHAKKIRSVGYETRPDRLAKLDNRTREAALVRRTRAELTAHVKNPTVVQAALIERASWMTLRINLLEARLSGGEAMSDHAAKQYIALSNALRRTLDAIGIQAAPSRTPSLAELMAQPQGAAA